MEPNFDFFSSIGMIKSLKKIKLLLHPKPGAADDPEKKESLRNDEFTLVYRLSKNHLESQKNLSTFNKDLPYEPGDGHPSQRW